MRNTEHETISHHQWLTLFACVLMWGPSLFQLLLEKSLTKFKIPEPVSVFLFLLGHMHNLLRSNHIISKLVYFHTTSLGQSCMCYLPIMTSLWLAMGGRLEVSTWARGGASGGGVSVNHPGPVPTVFILYKT